MLWRESRSRLFSVSVLLVMLFAVAGGVWLKVVVGPLLLSQAEAELLHQAQLVAATYADATELRTTPADQGGLHALAHRLGDASTGRVTFLTKDGRVLGDSHVHADQLHQLDDHGGREEVQAALASPRAWASARRWSATLNRDMLYVALVTSADPHGIIIRVSLPTDRVDAPLHHMSRILALVTIVGIVVAGLMPLLASGLLSRDLGRVMEQTTSIARGETPAPDEDASLIDLGGVGSAVQDLSTDLQNAVSTLARERRQLEAVLGSMSEGILALDTEDRVTLVNGAFTKLLGCSPEDRGRPVADAIDEPELIAHIQDAEAGETHEITLEHAVHGENRLLLARIERRVTRDTVVVLHDVTNLRRLENIRRDFVANVSHELRTPVSIVQASAEALQDGAMEEPVFANQFLDAILRNTERLGMLISDLLSLSRIEEGRYSLVLASLQLRPIIDEVLDVLALRAKARNHTLSVEIPRGTMLVCDAGALEQVLMNLLENAMKYTPDGGTIALRAVHATEGRVLLEVADNGPGIDPAHHDRVFERFYRVDSGRSREVGGTGLGLAIVKHLCETMNGHTGVRANRPKGSVFWVELAGQLGDATPPKDGPPASPSDIAPTATTPSPLETS